MIYQDAYGWHSGFSEFGPLAMEITTLRLVLRRGFILFEYVSGDYNERERGGGREREREGERERDRERGERIQMRELSPEANGGRVEGEEWEPVKLCGGGGLYRVRHPLTYYVIN